MRSLLELTAAAALCLSAAGAALGATITPTTTGDDNATNGNCTLREAVRAANANAAVDACAAGDSGSTDVIDLRAPASGTRSAPAWTSAAS